MSEQTGYLAAPGFEPQLARALSEVGEVSATHGRLFVAPGPARPMPWAAAVTSAVFPASRSVMSLFSNSLKVAKCSRF